RGEFGSLGGSKALGQIHNGADDNASGTAGVLELAGFFQPLASELKRDVLFVCFTAEEMGLLGSKHYVDSPLIPIHKCAAMINLDMVGYLKTTGKLEIYGVGTAPSFQRRLDEANRSTRVRLRPIEGVGRGASDHYPFYQKGLPVLFLITGLHKNYHRPTDDWKYLDPRGFEKVVKLAGNLAYDLATADTRPVFTPTTEGGLETGPFLGVTVEDRDGGVYIADVARGSPADRAGLKKDDRLAEVDDQEIASVAMFYGVWASVQAEARVSLVIGRSGRLRTVRVQLEK
ncbi:MAG: M28 family peptidase, partial [bacterium]